MFFFELVFGVEYFGELVTVDDIGFVFLVFGGNFPGSFYTVNFLHLVTDIILRVVYTIINVIVSRREVDGKVFRILSFVCSGNVIVLLFLWLEVGGGLSGSRREILLGLEHIITNIVIIVITVIMEDQRHLRGFLSKRKGLVGGLVFVSF